MSSYSEMEKAHYQMEMVFAPTVETHTHAHTLDVHVYAQPRTKHICMQYNAA